MRLVIGQDEIVANFVGAGLKRPIHPPFVAIGWVAVDQNDNWRLATGAVFNDYTGANLEVTIFGRLTRGVIRDIAAYAFAQVKCQRLTARTMRANAAMRRMLPRLGFVFEGEMRHFFGSVRSHNALIYRLDARAAERWLP